MTEKVMAYKCESCGELSTELGGSLYECGDCSTKFNRDNSADGVSHRCPDCNKFAGKIADQSCIECDDGEVEEVEAWQDESGELFETEEEAADGSEEARVSREKRNQDFQSTLATLHKKEA